MKKVFLNQLSKTHAFWNEFSKTKLLGKSSMIYEMYFETKFLKQNFQNIYNNFLNEIFWNISLFFFLSKRELGSICFHRCTVHKERNERISLVWIQGFARRRRRGYTCEQ